MKLEARFNDHHKANPRLWIFSATDYPALMDRVHGWALEEDAERDARMIDEYHSESYDRMREERAERAS